MTQGNFASIERIVADDTYRRTSIVVESTALAAPAADIAKTQERRARLWIVSPSQHEKCACPRRWGIRYLDGLKGPDKESARLGTAMHAVLERYYIERVLPETVITPGMVAFMAPRAVNPHDCIYMTESALCGLKYAPTPHDSLKIEHAFDLEIAQNTYEQGKIDVYDPTRASGFRVGQFAEPTRGQEPSGWLTHDARGLPIPLVVDHKSTGDFKWLKNDDVLRGTPHVRGDPQPAIYGACALRDFVAAYGVLPEYVHFRWVYYLRSKGKPNARAVDLRMTPQEIIATVQTLTPEAQQLIWLAASDKQGNDLPPNTSECPKFGGCEYGPRHMNVCRMSDGERLRARMLSNPPPNLAAQVAAFQQPQQQAAQPQGIFGQQNAPPAQPAPQGIFAQAAPQNAQPAPQGIFGDAQPVQQQQQQAAQPQGIFAQQAAPQNAQPQGIFGAQPAQQQQPAQAQPSFMQQQPAQPTFTQQPAQQQFAPPVQPAQMFAPPQAAQQQFAPPAPVVQPPSDPRLSDGSIPAHIPQDKYGEYLAYVDAAGLDHRNQQPIAQGQPMWTGAIAQYQKQPDGRDVLFFFGSNEKGQNVLVQNDYKSLRAPSAGAMTSTPGADAKPPKKPRKSKKNADGTAAAPQAGDDDEDESPQIVLTVHAIDQLIGFLQSLRASAPQG